MAMLTSMFKHRPLDDYDADHMDIQDYPQEPSVYQKDYDSSLEEAQWRSPADEDDPRNVTPMLTNGESRVSSAVPQSPAAAIEELPDSDDDVTMEDCASEQSKLVERSMKGAQKRQKRKRSPTPSVAGDDGESSSFLLPCTQGLTDALCNKTLPLSQ
jgi:hypothetical protein